MLLGAQEPGNKKPLRYMYAPIDPVALEETSTSAFGDTDSPGKKVHMKFPIKGNLCCWGKLMLSCLK